MIDPWPYINGAYGAAVVFFAAAAWLTLSRYRRAQARLKQAETL